MKAVREQVPESGSRQAKLVQTKAEVGMWNVKKWPPPHAE